VAELKPIYVSIPEAMRLLGIGRTKLYDLIRFNDITRVHIGSKSLISVESIERYAALLGDAASS
jgi:excisionase family DNA binding protein